MQGIKFLKEIINYEKKLQFFFLAVLALTFVACGKGEGGIVDKIKSLDNTTSQSETSTDSFSS